MGFELNGALYSYGDDNKSFLQRIGAQDYKNKSDKGWDAYLQECSKEINFVDQILATGGKGQGETLNIPQDTGSNYFPIIFQ